MTDLTNAGVFEFGVLGSRTCEVRTFVVSKSKTVLAESLADK